MMNKIKPFAIVAIPASNEADRIERCLAALAVQRDPFGAPVSADAFEILVFANNCDDFTAAIARRFAHMVLQRIVVVEDMLPPEMANAGWARKRAMDLAADRLEAVGQGHVIMTTDADSCVGPTWFSANLHELAKGVECVAGYIDAEPLEIVSLGRDFLARGRLEDTYLRLVAEIIARCDPRAHDPWPNHRVSSGASLALTVAAYRAIGGLPARSLGEDAALTASLDEAGFRVRHALEVFVQTSCRIAGRAPGGAADTMQRRLADLNAPCDDDLEPALQIARRAMCRSLLRRVWQNGVVESPIAVRLQISTDVIRRLLAEEATFQEAWDALSSESPVLKNRRTLRPSELPREIAIARMVVASLQAAAITRTTAPADRFHREGSGEPELA
jgi:hypothetical protein